MKTTELAGLLECETICPCAEEGPVLGCYTSDLLSDVMAHAKEGYILVTIQAHKNTVAVASLLGLKAIVVCNSRPVPDDMVVAAKEEGIAILRTALNQYRVSGRLYGQLEEQA
jgi:hypothetical protein